MGALLHGLMMGTFLVAGRLRSRVERQPIVNRDLVFNVVNGLALFVVRLTGVAWVSEHLRLGCQAGVLGAGVEVRIINVFGEEPNV